MNDKLSDIAGRPIAALPGPAERIRLRNAFGISQQTLAKALGVSRRTVGTWESGRGEPTGTNRKQYAEILAIWARREHDNESE